MNNGDVGTAWGNFGSAVSESEYLLSFRRDVCHKYGLPFDMKTKRYHYNRWLIQAPAGLVLVGMGLCFVAESTVLKHSGATTWQWVLAGTVSLSVVNSGLCLLADAVLQRVRYEWKQQQESS